MLRIGYHISSASGYTSMAREALYSDANTFAFFTRNPRGSSVKALDMKDIETFNLISSEKDLRKLVAHAPYTLNPCAKTEHIREFTADVIAEDIRRMEYTPFNYYNLHPGNHMEQGIDAGINFVSDMLNKVLRDDQTTIVLIETMAGKGTEIGGKFEEIKAIINNVTLKEKIGVCFDTCHTWDAGYDVRGNLDAVLAEFDRVIGLDWLRAIHLNDSLNEKASKKDRHAKIGEGKIGTDAIKRIINHKYLKHLPFILETPAGVEEHKTEIEMLKNLYE